jgi:hypothetical protein
MNFDTVLLPELVTQMEPEPSTATLLGLLSEPSPAVGESGDAEP